MFQRKNWRIITLLVTLILLTVISLFALNRENTTCMGVSICSDEDFSSLTRSPHTDLSNILMHNNEPAAVDTSSATVYISQSVDSNTHIADLKGVLTTQDTRYHLYFAEDPYFNDLQAAVSEAHRFRLMICYGQSSYVEYGVVLTTLPVMRLEGAASYVDEEGRNVFSGHVCLWSPDDPAAGSYSVKTSHVEWNTRGHSTSFMPKKSMKLSLKDKHNRNKSVSFMNLGKDDDWILNAMSMDDLKLREHLFMSLWNDLCTTTPYNYKMSDGKYVEVVLNGEYQGLYMLQRRLDAKYLKLEPGSVLVRGDKMYSNGPFDKTAIRDVLNNIASFSDCSAINPENWIDNELFIEFSWAADNRGTYFYNNMAYIVSPNQPSPNVSYVLWDTDVTFGIHINPTGGFFYYPGSADSGENIQRVEYGSMKKLYPDLEQTLAVRWQQLRQGVLSKDNLFEIISSCHAQTTDSGALSRDRALWGEYYGGEDNLDALFTYIEKRLAWMDSYYGQFLP